MLPLYLAYIQLLVSSKADLRNAVYGFKTKGMGHVSEVLIIQHPENDCYHPRGFFIIHFAVNFYIRSEQQADS